MNSAPVRIGVVADTHCPEFIDRLPVRIAELLAGVDLILHAGALLFNPGAVYQVTPVEARRRLQRRPSWFEWSWLQVMRHRRVWPRPTVGLLELGPGGITASILPL